MENEHEFIVNDLIKGHTEKLYTDLTIVLSDGVRVETNKFMLACRSDYFATMLSSALKEGTSNQIELKSCDSKVFGSILDYVWCGKVEFSKLSTSHILEMMENARMMCFDRLVLGIEAYIEGLIKNKDIVPHDSLVILEFCVTHKFDKLIDLVIQFIDSNFGDISSEDYFYQLSRASILSILQPKCKLTPEIDVFRVLTKWMTSNPSIDTLAKTEILSMVDLVNIDLPDLLGFVRETNYFDEKSLLDAMGQQMKVNAVEEGENICSEVNDGKLTVGQFRGDGNCLRSPPHEYDNQEGFTYALLHNRIIVEFKTEAFINKIEFLLWDLDERNYSYILESSIDGIEWTTIIDCTNMQCQSTQRIFFRTTKAKFISVIGTRNSYDEDSEGDRIHIVSLSAHLDTTTRYKESFGMVNLLKVN